MNTLNLSTPVEMAPLPQFVTSEVGTSTTTPPEAQATDNDPSLIGVAGLTVGVVIVGVYISTFFSKKPKPDA